MAPPPMPTPHGTPAPWPWCEVELLEGNAPEEIDVRGLFQSQTGWEFSQHTLVTSTEPFTSTLFCTGGICDNVEQGDDFVYINGETEADWSEYMLSTTEVEDLSISYLGVYTTEAGVTYNECSYQYVAPPEEFKANLPLVEVSH